MAACGLAALCAIALAGVTGAILMVVLVFLGAVPWLPERLDWCLTVGTHHRVPTVQGATALTALVAMVVCGWQRLRRLRGTSAVGDEQPVIVVPTSQPVAFAVPGRPGHVVVSKGMLQRLDADERRVLFAHEQSHLRNEHHRYVWVSEVAAAALPILRPLRRAVHLSTERWADEEAATEVGDRRLVARAICRAALTPPATEAVPGLRMTGGDVPCRVEALLRPQHHHGRSGRIGLATVIAVVAIAFAASVVQVHHLAVFALHLCTGL